MRARARAHSVTHPTRSGLRPPSPQSRLRDAAAGRPARWWCLPIVGILSRNFASFTHVLFGIIVVIIAHVVTLEIENAPCSSHLNPLAFLGDCSIFPSAALTAATKVNLSLVCRLCEATQALECFSAALQLAAAVVHHRRRFAIICCRARNQNA